MWNDPLPLDYKSTLPPEWRLKVKVTKEKIRAKMLPEKALEAVPIRTPIGANRSLRTEATKTFQTVNSPKSRSPRLRRQLDHDLMRKPLVEAQLNKHR